MFLERFKQDIKERFLNFETIKGTYLLPAGLAGMWVTWTNLQFILHAMGSVYFGYMIIEGARKILVNRVKQKIAQEQLVEKRVQLNVAKVIPAVHHTEVGPT